MPVYVVGKDLWQEEIGRAGLLLFTANSAVTSSGELVMGRGAALEAKQRYPDLPRILADQLESGGLIGHGLINQRYGVLLSSVFDDGTQIGAFQVKLHWADPAILALIAHSAIALRELCPLFERIAMNYPGVGAGRLLKEKVEPILRILPDNVYIYSTDATKVTG